MAIKWRKYLGTSNSEEIDSSDTNPLPVSLRDSSNSLSDLDSNNCSVVALGIGGVFTGVFTDLVNYTNVSIAINTSQASATNGLIIQWSMDGVTVDDTDSFSIRAMASKQFTFGVAHKYYRVQYTNSAVATTVRLQSILHKNAPKPSSHRIQDTIQDEDDAELVKSVITGLSGNGTFVNAMVDTTGRLETVSQPYLFSVAEGVIVGHQSLLKFGTRTAVAAATESVIWEGTAPTYTYLPTTQQLKVSSTSAVDTALGTGARTLRLIGLDTNYDEIQEDLILNGITAVTTVNSYSRVFRAYVLTCGTGLTNAGTISVLNNASTVTQLVINPNDSQTLMTMWTVPRGKTLWLTSLSFSTDSNKGARISIYIRQLDGGILYPWRIQYRAYTFSGNEIFPFGIPFRIPEKTDIEIRVSTPASAGVTSAGSTFEGWYELN